MVNECDKVVIKHASLPHNITHLCWFLSTRYRCVWVIKLWAKMKNCTVFGSCQMTENRERPFSVQFHKNALNLFIAEAAFIAIIYIYTLRHKQQQSIIFRKVKFILFFACTKSQCNRRFLFSSYRAVCAFFSFSLFHLSLIQFRRTERWLSPFEL